MFCKVPISQKYEQTPVVLICPMRSIEENVIKIVISAWSVCPNNWAIQIITGSCFLSKLDYLALQASTIIMLIGSADYVKQS